jgi:hypothetical protein
MKKLCYAIILIALFLSFTTAFSQVAVNTSGAPADQSAILDVSSTAKGLLIPRVTLTSLSDNISPVQNPAEGLLIYNQGGTQAQGFYFWKYPNWVSLATMNDVNTTINSLVTDRAYGEMYEYHSIGTYTTLHITSSGAWVPWGTATVGDTMGMTFSPVRCDTSRFTIETGGTFRAEFSAAVQVEAGGKIIDVALFKNDARQDDLHARIFQKEGGKALNISFSGIIQLAPGDHVDIRFSMNANENMRIDLANFNLAKID